MADRKKDIIEATLKLASAHGLGTVSMQQIANEVGISKASLYNHFSSRDEIVEAMYENLRAISKEKSGVGKVDYDSLASAKSLKEILSGAVNSYRKIVSDPNLLLFYKIIMSERSINTAAAEIMVKETKTMIDASKALFYALQVKGIADFKDADAAAFSFTMAVHSIINYEFDLKMSGAKTDKKMMTDFINEFCRIYAKK
ncbi:MAG: helix-turn-helix transcriptional regulator [Lachnospiraceae bacterium]|nr:helix-turn-helix transcriptional regulator [Lachnospiraceae bacterium]